MSDTTPLDVIHCLRESKVWDGENPFYQFITTLAVLYDGKAYVSEFITLDSLFLQRIEIDVSIRKMFDQVELEYDDEFIEEFVLLLLPFDYYSYDADYTTVEMEFENE